jgi:hypothetical protein
MADNKELEQVWKDNKELEQVWKKMNILINMIKERNCEEEIMLPFIYI